MGTIFIYNDKLFQALDLDKKLRRMRVKKKDIEIVLDKDEITKEDLDMAFNRLYNPVRVIDESSDVKLHYWRNIKNKKLLGSVSCVLTQEWLDRTNNGLLSDWIVIMEDEL